MTALSLLPQQDARARRDRLEVLTALTNGPEFDPVLRGGVLKIPPTHSVYPWSCTVIDCARPRWRRYAMCSVHAGQWQEAEARGMSRAQFLRTVEPLPATEMPEAMMCQICPRRPAFSLQLVLCFRHRNRWLSHLKRHPGGGEAEFERWLADQPSLPGYGECRADVCDELAVSPLGLCGAHERGYIRAARPGGATLPKNFFATYERGDRPVPVTCEDEVAFRAWCRAQLPVHRTGTVNLRGLRPLLRAELQWGMYVHGLQPVAVWHLTWVQSLADECQRRDLDSLAGLDASVFRRAYHQRMVQEMQQALRKIYFTPSETRDAGYIETEHFGMRFPPPLQLHRPDLHHPAVAARPLVGSHRRCAALTHLSAQRPAGGLRAPRRRRTVRVFGGGGAGWRPRPVRSGRRARLPLRRGPAQPRTPRAGVSRTGPPGRQKGEGHRELASNGVQLRPVSSARRAGQRQRRANRPGPRLHRRHAGRRPGHAPQP